MLPSDKNAPSARRSRTVQTALTLQSLGYDSLVVFPPFVEQCYRVEVVDYHAYTPEQKWQEKPQSRAAQHEVGQRVPATQEYVPQHVECQMHQEQTDRTPTFDPKSLSAVTAGLWVQLGPASYDTPRLPGNSINVGAGGVE